MKKIHLDMNNIMVSYIIGKKQLVCKLFFSLRRLRKCFARVKYHLYLKEE